MRMPTATSSTGTHSTFRVIVVDPIGVPVIVDSGISRERAEKIRSALSPILRDVTVEEVVIQLEEAGRATI